MKQTKFLSIVLLLLLGNNSLANNFLPAQIYQLDDHFTHHVVLVEKSTHSLFLYQFKEKENPVLMKKFTILTGKFTGNKSYQGDKKTPEGIYFFQNFHPASFLEKKYGDYGKIYGAGAFTMNYPNIIDIRNNKTGGGIWLHSTDDDKRILLGLDSKGCVVATDKDLKEISQYIDLGNTPVIVVQDMHFLKKETWLKNKIEIEKLVNDWSSAWQAKDFTTYINSYSKSKFRHPRRGRYKAFKTYKRYVFARKDSPQIELTQKSILAIDDYVVVTMRQDYNSPSIKDIGKKVLYLQQNDRYQWKIVAEDWSKMNEERNIAFTPNKTKYFTQKD